jgi:hypothetical protein
VGWVRCRLWGGGEGGVGIGAKRRKGGPWGVEEEGRRRGLEIGSMRIRICEKYANGGEGQRYRRIGREEEEKRVERDRRGVERIEEKRARQREKH